MAKFSTTGICTWKLLKYGDDDDENAHQNEMDGESDDSYYPSFRCMAVVKKKNPTSK